jgi:hypothetical protein
MATFKYGIAVLGLTLLFVSMAAGQSVVAVGSPAGTAAARQEQKSAALQKDLFDQITFYMNGMVEFFWTVPDPAALLDGNIIPRNAKQAAQLFLMKYAEPMGIDNVNEFHIISVEPGDNGRSDVIMEQYHNDIPILTTRLVMTVENRLVTYVMGRIVSDTSVLTSGTGIDPQGVVRALRQAKILKNDDGLSNVKVVYFPTPQRVHYSFELIEEVLSQSDDGVPLQVHIEEFRDGESGSLELLESYSTYHTAR